MDINKYREFLETELQEYQSQVDLLQKAVGRGEKKGIALAQAEAKVEVVRFFLMNLMIREVKEMNCAEQIDRLAEFIMKEVDGEPSKNEGAVDTAIRLLRVREVE